MNKYFEVIKHQLDLVADNQNEQLNSASKLVEKVLKESGLIYVFGCGHSHIFAEELFYRAGGLANIVPILYEPLMLHKGAMQSSVNEKKNKYAETFIEDYHINEKDLLIVISTSGINPVPIDVAQYGQKMGAQVLTISSFIYKKFEHSRHQQGLYLSEIGDVNIDNYVLHGDAYFKNGLIRHTPISTITGIAIIHEIISKAIISTNFQDIFLSGNITGSNKHNYDLVKKYSNMIPMLMENLEKK